MVINGNYIIINTNIFLNNYRPGPLLRLLE